MAKVAESFIPMAEVQRRISQLNRQQRQLSRNKRIHSVRQLSEFSPLELANLARLIAGCQNRPTN